MASAIGFLILSVLCWLSGAAGVIGLLKLQGQELTPQKVFWPATVGMICGMLFHIYMVS
jgi:hypothetical protein